MSGSGYSFPGGTISGCKRVGGYFVSSWFYKGDPDNLVGIAANNVWSIHGGYNHYNSAAMDINTVKDAFKTAQDNGDVPAGVNWNTVGWFCSKKPDDSCTEDDPYYPTCEPPEPDPEYGDAEFYSQSSVEVFDPEITGGRKETSDRNGQVKVYFSTDKTHVEVEFSHLVGYGNGGNGKLTSGDTASSGTVFTKWKVSDAYTVPKTQWGDIEPWSSTTTTPAEAKQRVSFDWAKDEYGSKEKCSKITYNHRTVSLTKTPVYKCDLTGCWIDHYNWSSDYSDSGSSFACAVVVRPEPSKGNPGPTSPGGGVTNEIMFAGEDTSLIWRGISAKGVPTRRLRDAQAIKFLVDEIPGYDGSKLAKVPTTKSDPCETYTARFGANLRKCQEHESKTHNTETELKVEESYGAEANVKVPDEVGYKYCHSYGYSFEYWFGVLKGDSEVRLDEDDIEWTHDTPKDYWYVFNASCRGVAKKPSVAVWNGSLLTSGSIITSLARRHNAITFGEAADGNRTLYGSWAEYLMAANSGLESSRTMGSGSSLSKGSGTSKLCEGDVLSTNSTMTIANSVLGSTDCALRPSGIQPNSTFIVRLNAYLRDAENKAQIKKIGSVGELYGGVSGNVVLAASGDVNIDHDIQINDGASYTLHSVPQAIIFTNGNININENVQRIDAWLIAPYGSINTCTSFADGNTTSDGKNREGNNCTKQLVFNGPVITKNMQLRRSYGSDPLISRRGTFGTASEKQTPAEVFNLRADSYIWGYAQASRYGSSYSEAYSRELAPRY